MSAITPSTNVKLLKLPLELDNENQLTFSSVSSQYNYFNSLPSLAANNFTYQRKDGVIRFPGCIDDLLQYNYVMYQNSAFGNKWFYAYIDKMTFVSPEMTDISIRTDAFQTWQFDITYLESFVEREHVDDDTIGKHTIPEGLEKGEMIINAKDTIEPNIATMDGGEFVAFDQPGVNPQLISQQFMIVFQLSDKLPAPASADDHWAGEVPWYSNNMYNGIFSGLLYVGVQTPEEAINLIYAYDLAGKGGNSDKNAIISIFIAPKEMFSGAFRYTTAFKNRAGDTQTTASANLYYPTTGSGSTYNQLSTLANKTININTTLDGYTPKNNKTFTKEFNYMYITNNAGIDHTYYYEDFADPAHPAFYMGGNIGQGCSIKLSPVNFKIRPTLPGDEFAWGLTGAKYPICAWKSDYYVNWETQNAVNNGIRMAQGVLGMGTGALNTVVGATQRSPFAVIQGGTQIGSGALQIMSALEERRQAQIVPDTGHGNTNCSDVAFSWRRYFTIEQMSVRAEMAKVCDDFMSMYGYKVNSVKTPNITGRRNWNYVKTIRGKIHGLIPKEDLNTISGMLDNGVTFWHSPSTFLDYSQTNDII